MTNGEKTDAVPIPGLDSVPVRGLDSLAKTIIGGGGSALAVAIVWLAGQFMTLNNHVEDVTIQLETNKSVLGEILDERNERLRELADDGDVQRTRIDGLHSRIDAIHHALTRAGIDPE